MGSSAPSEDSWSTRLLLASANPELDYSTSPEKVRRTYVPGGRRLPGLHDLEGLWGYLNSKGEVRLESVRNPESERVLDLNASEDRIALVRLFREWVTNDDYALLESEDSHGRILHGIKLAKRGNDVAVSQIEARLRDLEDRVMRYADYPMTGVLFVTLTYNPEKVPEGIEAAWRRLGKDYNRFMASVRKWVREAYPGAKVWAHRSWEAHKSGWPHAHVVLCFDKVRFPTWQQERNEDQYLYRVDDATKDKIASLWNDPKLGQLGHVDVQAVPSGKVPQRMRDVLWYVSKDSTEADYRTIETWTWKKLLGLSICWYLGLRMWSASKALVGSARDLTRAVKLTQTNLAGELVIPETADATKWTFVGLIKGAHAGIPSEEWHRIHPLPPRRVVRRAAAGPERPLCACGARAVGVVHEPDADEDVPLCKVHAPIARDAYPEWVSQAWIPKRMRKRTGGGNLAEALA